MITGPCTSNPRGLECIEDIFLKHVVKELKRGHALLDLLLTNREKLVEKVKVKGSLGCNYCETWQAPRKTDLEGKGSQESRSIFKDNLLRA